MRRLNESRIGGVLTDAFAVRAAASLRSTLHARHSVALIVGLDSDVTVAGSSGPCVRGRVVLVPPDVPHAATCPGPMLAIYHEPEAAPEVAGYARLHGEARSLAGVLGARLGDAVVAHRASLARAEVLSGLAHEAAARFAGAAPRRGIDRRVARVLEALVDPTCERAVLERPGISQAHLQALFVRDVGLPIRRFQLWHRLRFAIAACLRLDSTNAAYAAGFADLAHFSRTCRKLIGHSPTELRRGFITA